ncbi:uncharacterized protein EV422DRAFT_569144 [Fimicolochytrium jonesii]|uniref:uncharacterized protein n=1 Tax=Fimicolochytrium jonesii TaxID=1396493 RepID=UPI0022FE778E|nr:uncharacterized protein EV422DRAFT_569144 [Fimicolochytrium jonesii]KAI8818870.1 hypothetical protein EV422DRAFT_569144 [Fimicolochytrium jonesii]
MKVDAELQEKALCFANKSLGEQLLRLYVAVEEIGKHNKTAHKLQTESWEPSEELKTNVRREANRITRNPLTKSYVGNMKTLTQKIFDKQWGVTKTSGLVPARFKAVSKRASTALSRVKADMKRVIWDNKADSINRAKLDVFAHDLFGVKVVTENHLVGAAILQAITREMNAADRAPKQYWIAVSKKLEAMYKMDPAARKTLIDKCVKNDRMLYVDSSPSFNVDGNDEDKDDPNQSDGDGEPVTKKKVPDHVDDFGDEEDGLFSDDDASVGTANTLPLI